MPIPHKNFDKFLLLNGWRMPDTDKDYQEGHRRINSWWKTDAEAMDFEIDLPAVKSGHGLVNLVINDKKISELRLPRGAWYKVTLPLEDLNHNEPFMLTIAIAEAEDNFEDLIRLRNFKFINEHVKQGVKFTGIDEAPSFFALAEALKNDHSPLHCVWLYGIDGAAAEKKNMMSGNVHNWVPESPESHLSADFPKEKVSLYAYKPEALKDILGQLGSANTIIMVPDNLAGLHESLADSFQGENRHVYSCRQKKFLQ